MVGDANRSGNALLTLLVDDLEVHLTEVTREGLLVAPEGSPPDPRATRPRCPHAVRVYRHLRGQPGPCRSRLLAWRSRNSLHASRVVDPKHPGPIDTVPELVRSETITDPEGNKITFGEDLTGGDRP